MRVHHSALAFACLFMIFAGFRVFRRLHLEINFLAVCFRVCVRVRVRVRVRGQKKERLPTKMAGQLVRAVPVVQSGSDSDEDGADGAYDAQENGDEEEEEVDDDDDDVYVSDDDDEHVELDGDELGGGTGNFADVDENYGEDEDVHEVEDGTDPSRHVKSRSSVLAAAAAAELELDPEARRAARAMRVATVKLKLATVAEAVLEDPENNVHLHQCDAGSWNSLFIGGSFACVCLCVFLVCEVKFEIVCHPLSVHVWHVMRRRFIV